MTRPWPFAALVVASLALSALQQGYDKLAPFTGVRWNGDEPVVEIGGTWVTLESIDGTPAKDIVEFCKKTWPDKWQKRFGEDLVEALTRMGKPPGEKVDLKAKDSLTGKPLLFPAVKMTKENRNKIWAPRTAGTITLAQAKEDLAQLKTHLEERYSYLELKGIDWKQALLDIEAALPDALAPELLSLALMRFLAPFGDGHSGLEEDPVTPGYSRFLIGDAGGRLVAFNPDRQAFFDPEHPYLRLIDDKPVAEWVKAASPFVSAGSPAYVRHQGVRFLRNLAFLRTELKIEASPTVKVELEAEKGGKTRIVDMPLHMRRPTYGAWPVTEHRELEGQVGYLRIDDMTGDRDAVAAIVKALEKFKTTRGLIIDVRGNGGGTRDILRAIFPYFMKSTDPLHVANVAAYRLPPDEVPDKAEGYLQDRELHPLTSPAWTPAERSSIEKFAKTFQPQWNPRAGQFSAWHYFALKRGAAPFWYDHPVVILMDTNCFSATDIFLSAFKGWRNVTLMGTTSGGGSGRARGLTLKHSRIQMKLSTIASFRRDGSLYDGKGVAPDVEIHPQATDFLKGEGDSVLDAALKRFKK